MTDTAPLDRIHDLVTCTEVADHLQAPAEAFTRPRPLVRPGSWRALLTAFQTDDGRFAGWHDRKDPSQVVLYHAQTFRHLADLWDWACEIPARDGVKSRRPGGLAA